jgi:pyruvate/2-oxoglutarate dehydrogenase complex dihydrolipoamide dehydrogenase (E3) component
MTYDLVIVGIGSGGLAAAEFAAGLGLRVAVVAPDRRGLESATMPFAALAASAKAAHTLRSAHLVGITSVEPTIDLARVWRRARAVHADIAATDANPQRYRDLGVELIDGDALVSGPNEVTLHTAGQQPRMLATRYILLCTGARPAIPAIDGLDPHHCQTAEELFELEAPPASMAIIGGGNIGVEAAQALRRLGIAVTVFERARTLLPAEEPTLVARLTEVLVEEGVVVHCTADVRSLQHRADGTSELLAVVGDDAREVHVQVGGVLLAAGRRANTGGLGLADVGVSTNEHGVAIDDRGRTSVRTIYAAGDVTGTSHGGSSTFDAVRAVRDMFFPGKGNLAAPAPSCVFSDPELARVGLTVEQAEQQHGTDTDVWHFDLARSERGRAEARAEGTVVVITAKGRVVGGHVLAPGAGEMIHELSLAIHRELRLDELAETPYLYPTYAGAIGQLAAEAAYEKAQRLRWLMKRR